MKKINILLNTLLLLFLFASCSNEDSNFWQSEKPIGDYILTVQNFQRASSSRTAIILPDNDIDGACFIWTEKDTIDITPSSGAQAYFAITEGAYSDKATFNGGAWALKTYEGNDYAAYYPFIGDIYLDRTKIPVNYTGQCYKPATNYTLTSLAAYDYMAAKPGVAKSSSNVSFDFLHLSALVEIQFALPASGAVKSLTLTSEENLFPTTSTFDLTAETVAITVDETKKTSTFTVAVEELTANANETVSVFFMLPPTDISSKKLTATITYGENNSTETFTLSEGKNMQTGPWYTLKKGITVLEFITFNNNFANNVNSALGTLGGTKLKFVANSTTTSDNPIYTDATNEVTAYAVRNGNWLEVHALANEFKIADGVKFTKTNIKNITSLDITALNTEDVTSMYGMFQNCSKLESIIWSEKFNTENVKNMYQMFYNCKLPTSLDISNFTFNSSPSTTYMFYYTNSTCTIYVSSAGKTYLIGKYHGASESQFVEKE